MFLVKTLYQFVKGSLVAPSTSIMKTLTSFKNLSENVLSTQLSTTDFYILAKSITSYNNKSLQKSLYTLQKVFSLTSDCNLPIFTANETITNLVYTFQSNTIKFENPKSSLHFKRFIVSFLTTLNLRKPKVR